MLLSMNVDAPFRVQELAVDNGSRFLSLKANAECVTVILPGHDYAAAAHARDIAERLIEAANALEDALEDALDAQREQVEAAARDEWEAGERARAEGHS